MFATNISAPLDRLKISFTARSAESFNIKKLYRRRLSMNKLVLCAKAAKWRFQPPFGGLRGNARALFIPGWKARDRLPIG